MSFSKLRLNGLHTVAITKRSIYFHIVLISSYSTNTLPGWGEHLLACPLSARGATFAADETASCLHPFGTGFGGNWHKAGVLCCFDLCALEGKITVAAGSLRGATGETKRKLVIFMPMQSCLLWFDLNTLGDLRKYSGGTSRSRADACTGKQLVNPTVYVVRGG